MQLNFLPRGPHYPGNFLLAVQVQTQTHTQRNAYVLRFVSVSCFRTETSYTESPPFQNLK